MATVCPKLNKLDENPPGILTVDNRFEPRLSTYNRTVGTEVTLTCALDAFRLTPDNPRLTCQSNGQWNGEIPICEAATTRVSTTPEPPGGLTDEQTLIIGITGGIGAFIFLILVVLIVAILVMQRRVRKRKSDEVRLRHGPPGTEISSVASYYPVDNRPFGPSYSYHPPTYSSHERYLEGDRRKLAPITLPPATHSYDVYNNPTFRPDIDERDVMPPRRKDDLLDVIARERMDQMKYDKERFAGDNVTGEASRANGKRFAKRGGRVPEAVVRAQRTLQYVEEHSNSPTPSYIDQGPYSNNPSRDQGRPGDRLGQGRYPDDFRSLDRYHDDRRRYEENYISEQLRYYGNPRDSNRFSRDPRDPARDYPMFDDLRGYERPQTGYDRPPSQDIDAKHWRPQTRTHYTQNRYR